jgi:hypothetical protein
MNKVIKMFFHKIFHIVRYIKKREITPNQFTTYMTLNYNVHFLWFLNSFGAMDNALDNNYVVSTGFPIIYVTISNICHFIIL